MTGQEGPPDRSPTIVDVARAAGVSKSLVSLALRGDAGVSQQRKDHILAVAEQLGYRANAAARALVSRSSALVGILLTDLANPYHTEVVAGVEEAAEKLGFRTILGNGQRRASRFDELLDVMMEMRVEGLVIVSSWVDGSALTRSMAGTPTVIVGRPGLRTKGVDTIANDDELGASLATQHLIDLGHRRIAHLTGGNRPAAKARQRGYERTMAAAGLGQEIAVFPGDTTHIAGFEAAERILHHDRRPTAVFVANDLAAVGFLGRCAELGVRVPDDLAVVGYDNTSLAHMWYPPLTSIDQPERRMGEIAVQLLGERRAGRTRAKHVVVEPTLVVRRSTTTPASR